MYKSLILVFGSLVFYSIWTTARYISLLEDTYELSDTEECYSCDAQEADFRFNNDNTGNVPVKQTTESLVDSIDSLLGLPNVERNSHLQEDPKTLPDVINIPSEEDDATTLPDVINIPFEEAVAGTTLQGWEEEWLADGDFNVKKWGKLNEPKIDFVYNCKSCPHESMSTVRSS
jgi:hypothetical protein